MADTEITVASFQTAIAECADAIGDADWTTAWTKLAKAEAIFHGLEQQLGKGDEHLRRRENLKGLRETLEMAEAKVTRGSDTKRLITTKMAY